MKTIEERINQIVEVLTKDNLTQLRDDYLRQALNEGAKTNFATGLLWGKVEMLNELLQEMEK